MLDWNFYFITNRELAGGKLLEKTEEALSAGIRVVQYREKNSPEYAMVKEAGELQRLCRKYGAAFIVNDSVAVAKKVDADGVHVGRNDASVKHAKTVLGAEKIVGASAANLDEALQADEDGADYLGVGPIFPTSTKQDAAPAMGLNALRKIADNTNAPIVAIGGITLENAGACIEAGAFSVAAMAAVYTRRGIKIEAALFEEKIKEAKEGWRATTA